MISVVIPCYNAEDDIADAIHSVLRQSRPNLVREIIIVDDGSTDRSAEIIEQLAASDDRIWYIHQENQGPSVARNTGVAHSSQEYVAFLDADDLWLQEKVERQARFLREHPMIGLLCSDFFIQFHDGAKQRVRATHFDHQRPDNLERLFTRGGPILMSTVVMKTSCFRSLEGFDPALLKGQDTDLWLRMAAEYPIHHVPKPLVLKRERPGSVGADSEAKAEYLHRITDKLIALHPHLKQLERRRNAHIGYFLGSYHLREGRRRQAAVAFAKSVALDATYWKSYVQLVISCIPLRHEKTNKLLSTVKQSASKIRRLFT
jgi:glycosyltransferase involved in cell wall biosynthesis